jgi:ATP-dependent exoDNAse (exonuclease V) alpha subunit
LKYEFITGVAGSGKTYEVKRRVAENPQYGTLVASTGIASMNLGTTTLNGLVSYFDTTSLERKHRNGKLRKALLNLDRNGALKDRLIIDEISMVAADQVDILVRAFDQYFGGSKSIIAVGDFLQLPPVNAEFAFKARHWDRFAENTTRLTTIHRQHDPAFLAALNLIRSGDQTGADVLQEAGAEFHPAVDHDFKGVNLFPTNREADAMNNRKLAEHAGSLMIYNRALNGEPASEWREVPETILVKEGARVMITANDVIDREYANGDLGIVTYAHPMVVHVLLDRTGEVVEVFPTTRVNWDYTTYPAQNVGSISFMPIKLGYALTVHKAQGLTLASVQFDARHWFAANPALCYVALSRVREASNLRIVGSVDELAEKITVHPDVVRYI